MGLFDILTLHDYLTIGTLLIVLIVLLRSRHVTEPMTAEGRAFTFEFVRNNTGIAWAFLAILVFLFSLFRSAKGDIDQSISEMLKTLLAAAAGWMGNMLTGRPAMARSTDPLTGPIPGVGTTQETTTVTRQEAPVQSEKITETPEDK